MTKRRLSTALAPSGSSASAYPSWVTLEFCCKRTIIQDPSSVSTVDATTLAAARTSAGHPIQVSLLLKAPPATSHMCIQLPDGCDERHSIVIAAHGDSVLIQIGFGRGYEYGITDHFVYTAGDAAADPPRPPSLSLLPPYFLSSTLSRCLDSNQYHTSYHFVFNVNAAAAEYPWLPSSSLLPRYPHPRPLNSDGTGLLRHGDDEIVVAELMMAQVSQHKPEQRVAELLMLRSGEWSINRPAITRDDGGDCSDLPAVWKTDTVVNVGDRVLCWIDLCQGLMFYDVFEERPRLRYVPLPSDHCFGWASNRNVCVTAGGTVLKFVNIFPVCSCGGAGYCKSEHSHDAYTIRTWTLSTDHMEWVMDSMVDSTQLRAAFDGYKDLPHIQPAYPVVSMDETHVICFRLSQIYYDKDGDNTMWLVMVDMKSKTLQSVLPYPGGAWQMPGRVLLVSRVSYVRTTPQVITDGRTQKTEGAMEEEAGDDSSARMVKDSYQLKAGRAMRPRQLSKMYFGNEWVNK